MFQCAKRASHVGLVEREDSLPDECESSEITQMIMYIVRKDISPCMVRWTISIQ